MANLPIGTVTFLFTDVEGSVRLWEEHPSEMRAALARHDQLVQEHVERHDGVLVKARGEGDSCFAVFARATNALAAALAIQLALQTEQWPTPSPLRVRMALHTGEADLREGDYHGSAVNRCARLRAIAHGGQVLVSMATEELVRDSLPEDAELVDLGEQRLRDLTRHERVYELRHRDLPFDFPALRTVEACSNNLPLQLTSFVGRVGEIAELTRLLRTTRLLTLTGTGGCGKTRLALEFALLSTKHIGEFPDGIYFVDLSPLKDPALVIPTIARVLGVREAGHRPLIGALERFLKGRVLLLVLDNFEQVLQAAPEVAALLSACTGLRVIVTSREPLHLRSEQEYVVPPLGVPNLHLISSAPSLLSYPAVVLFVDRIQMANHDFELTDRNAATVAELCVRLDGLPLALELAAARGRTLTPAVMLQRLEGRLDLPGTGPRDLPTRQQTIQATLDWSYSLLSEEEQQLLRRLSAFAGGFTLLAAESICADDGGHSISGDVLDLLVRLVEKNLVRQLGPTESVTSEGAALRYGMLETVREYAQEQLRETGEAEWVRSRHAKYFLSFTEAAESRLHGPEQLACLEDLEREHDNLRTALAWSIARRDGETALRIAGPLWMFWWGHSHWSEGLSWLEQALAQSSAVSVRSRAKALSTLGYLLLIRGEPGRAQSPLEEGVALLREGGDRLTLARSLGSLSLWSWLVGDAARALALSNEALALARAEGDRFGVAYALRNQAGAQYYLGELDLAAASAMESIDVAPDPIGWAFGCLEGALVERGKGHLKRSISLVKEALSILRSIGEKWGVLLALMFLGEIALSEGAHGLATKLMGASSSIATESGAAVVATETAGLEQALGHLQSELGAEAFARAWAEGQAMTLEEAVEYALAETAEG